MAKSETLRQTLRASILFGGVALAATLLVFGSLLVFNWFTMTEGGTIDAGLPLNDLIKWVGLLSGTLGLTSGLAAAILWPIVVARPRRYAFRRGALAGAMIGAVAAFTFSASQIPYWRVQRIFMAAFGGQDPPSVAVFVIIAGLIVAVPSSLLGIAVGGFLARFQGWQVERATDAPPSI